MNEFPFLRIPLHDRRLRFIFVSLSAAVFLGIIPSTALAETPEEIKMLFGAYAGKGDKKAGNRLRRLGDEAVPFLADVIRKREPHPQEYTDVDGHHKVMGTWSQEASGILGGIETPLAVAEARKLAVHENSGVRFWGIMTLKSLRTERQENLAFLRSRLEAETGRNRSEIIEEIAKQRAESDLPLFRALAASDADVHVRLALWYAIALQGDKDALLEIVKVCENENGHLGVVYLGWITGKDFGWKMKEWRDWIANTSDEEFRKLVSAPNIAPAPPGPATGGPAPVFPVDTPVEVMEAVKWFDSLGFASVKGLGRVRITDEWGKKGAKKRSERQLNGWLLEEKEGEWRILAGPDVEAPFRWEGGEPWPLMEWTATEHDTVKDGWRSLRRIQKVDFKEEAEAILAALDSDDAGSLMGPRFGKVLSERAKVFLTGRDCLEQGLADLGFELLKRAPSIMRATDDNRAFSLVLAEEFATCTLWQITLKFGAPNISRETILAELELALKRFPSTNAATAMKAMADRLRNMIGEDREHARTVKPFDAMTKDEQAAELIFQLRNQNGMQISQPGWCDVFAGDHAMDDNKSPAAQLVKMGHAAVPALIGALDSDCYSRSVGFWRNFRFSHTVLTVGDCSLQTLQRIANRRFYSPRTTSSYMSRDEQVAGTRGEVEKWWKGVQEERKSR